MTITWIFAGAVFAAALFSGGFGAGQRFEQWRVRRARSPSEWRAR